MLYGCRDSVFALTDPVKYKHIKIYKNISVDTQFPRRAKPQDTKDINYWLSVLPEPQDRFFKNYIVVPLKGVVAPIIIEPKTSDRYKKTLAWQVPDFTKDLNRGVFHYPGTPSPQSLGNGVYFAHTSQFIKDKSKYGTIGQAFARLDIQRPKTQADVFYYYKKYAAQQRIVYEYEVIQEKRVKDTDMSVFHQDLTKREMSIVWCVDRWTARDRWITKGYLKQVDLLTYSASGIEQKIIYPLSSIDF